MAKSCRLLASWPLCTSGGKPQEPHGWIVADGRQLHLHFATEADAKAAEAIFQRYKFDHILHIGPNDGNGLTFYARAK